MYRPLERRATSGVSTPWAYRELSNSPETFGNEGQAVEVLKSLNAGKLDRFENSLETPVFRKHLVLPVLKKFLHENGALIALMSGSGSTLFAITNDRPEAETLRANYHNRFGQAGWSATVEL